MALAAYAGLRREEISGLDIASFREDCVEVLGKGKKRRTVFVPLVAARYVTSWLLMRGLDPGPLFWKSRRGGKPAPHRRLSPSGVWEVIRTVANRAGVADVTPHDFRRTYASTLLDHVDLATVQALLGHASPVTTSRYDRRGDEAKRRAADALARAFQA